MGVSFKQWAGSELQLSADDLETLRLVAAFDVLVCRCESARQRGAPDPLVTTSTRRAGGNSREVTRRMLGQLGYTRAQLRVIRRLLTGSTGGWPGLLPLFLAGRPLTLKQRTYARRQVQLFRAASDTPVKQSASPPRGGSAAAPAPGV